MGTRPKTRIPTDRSQLIELHEQHGSWSAVARVLGVHRATLNHVLNRLDLIGTVDHTASSNRLAAQSRWVMDRDELCRRLQKHGGVDATEAAEGISHTTIRRWARKHGLEPADWVPDAVDYGVQRFDKPLVLKGDWAVASDFQVPFTDRKMVQLLCRLAPAWGITNLLLAGDVLDLVHFSKYDPIDEPPDWETTKLFATKLFRTLAEAFPGEKIWIMGNHELRITRVTKGRFTMGELAAAVNAHDVKPVQAPGVYIETPRGIWEVIHPRSYSVIPTAVAKDLAVKRQHHVLVAHGHQVGYRRDPSGRLMCMDIGAMCDAGTLAYVQQMPTRHPEQRQGFALLRNGSAYLIEPDADIEFWTRAGRAG